MGLCEHLSSKEKDLLRKLMFKHEELFDGTLGIWDTKPVELELQDPNAKPHHARTYPVPQSQERKLKEEIQRLIKFKVLRKMNDSEWASPMFTVLKPDGSL